MEIQLTAEQEALLSHVASHEGKPVGQLLTECAAYVLRDNDRFLAEVEVGLAAAKRGDFIEEEEMDARVGATLIRIRWTLPAADDLEDVRDYLDLHSPQFSSSTVGKLYDGVRSPKSMPERGRTGLKPDTREIVFHPLPYIVTYQVTDQTVEILRIYHGAQDRREH